MTATAAQVEVGAQLKPGWYRIEVEASDTRGNTTVAAFPVRLKAA